MPIGYETFLVPFIISNGDGLLIVQDGDCVGKVYAVLLEVRSGLPRVPFAAVCHRSIVYAQLCILATVRVTDLRVNARETSAACLGIEVRRDPVGPTWG